MLANTRSTQPKLQSVACAGLEYVSLLTTVVIEKLVCASMQFDCLLFNDKLIHSGNMAEGCLLDLHVQVGAALSVLRISKQLLSQLDFVSFKCLCIICPTDSSSLCSGLLTETVSPVPSPLPGLCADQTDTTMPRRYTETNVYPQG